MRGGGGGELKRGPKEAEPRRQAFFFFACSLILIFSKIIPTLDSLSSSSPSPRHHQRQLGLAAHVRTNKRRGVHLGNAEPLVEFRQFHTHHHGVARDHGAAELAPLDPPKEEVLLRGLVLRVHHDDASELGHGLYLEDA